MKDLIKFVKWLGEENENDIRNGREAERFGDIDALIKVSVRVKTRKEIVEKMNEILLDTEQGD